MMQLSIDPQKQAEWLQIFLKYIRERTISQHVQEDEGYKFQDVQHFQGHFDLEATDLAGNLEGAIVNDNLVTGAMYFPRKMLIIYAQIFPEETRAALWALFDESVEAGERITAAQQTFNVLEERRSSQTAQPPANTFIGLRFLSLLLGMRYPNNYNPLKPSEWKVFARFVNPDFSMPHHTPPGEQYKIYSVYIDSLREYLQERPEIAEIKAALTDGLTFKDETYRWMTQDVIYVTARVFASVQAQGVDASAPVPGRSGSSVQPAKEPIELESNSVIDDESELNTGFMPLEKHLEEYVIKNWANINFGEPLRMYLDEDGTTGQQYTTDVGIIDILAQDEHDDFVVIELKRAESGYKVVGQVLNYMGWVQSRLATGGQKVRGMVIVGKADKTLRAAIQPVKGMVSLKEYRVRMDLEEVSNREII